jgi:hypothetical protein
MSCLVPNYNPIPTREWDRFENRCAYDAVDILTPKQAIIAEMNYKGNILQYKKNSSNLTKQQRYAQIAKGAWTNRTTTWASQTQKYTNPNTNSLQRVNYYKVPVSKLPYQYSLNCPNLINPITGQYEIPDGGNLLCNVVQNICSGQITQVTANQLCYPTTDSNVPGKIMQLCYNDGQQTYYPKTRLTYGSSGNKFPTNAKLIFSAVSK